MPRVAPPVGIVRPAPFAGVEVADSHFAALAAWAVSSLADESAVVIDPFAGHGTTVLVAEHLGREAYGVELVAERVAWARERAQHPERIHHGDSRRLGAVPGLPTGDVALCLTSPPFTGQWDPQDPLAGYAPGGAGYAAYLEGLAAVFDDVATRLHADGMVAVNLAHVYQDRATPLTWDVGRALTRSGALHFVDEVIVELDGAVSSVVLYRRP